MGILGEDLACSYLRKGGYRILERNYRCSLGEIDIVASMRRVLVFVEVKCGRTRLFGEPMEHVTAEKRRRLRRLGEHYAKRHGRDFPMTSWRYRFDVISIVIEELGGLEELVHIEDAF